jgi:hypothetical protein
MQLNDLDEKAVKKENTIVTFKELSDLLDQCRRTDYPTKPLVLENRGIDSVLAKQELTGFDWTQFTIFSFYDDDPIASYNKIILVLPDYKITSCDVYRLFRLQSTVPDAKMKDMIKNNITDDTRYVLANGESFRSIIFKRSNYSFLDFLYELCGDTLRLNAVEFYTCIDNNCEWIDTHLLYDQAIEQIRRDDKKIKSVKYDGIMYKIRLFDYNTFLRETNKHDAAAVEEKGLITTYKELRSVLDQIKNKTIIGTFKVRDLSVDRILSDVPKDSRIDLVDELLAWTIFGPMCTDMIADYNYARKHITDYTITSVDITRLLGKVPLDYSVLKSSISDDTQTTLGHVFYFRSRNTNIDFDYLTFLVDVCDDIQTSWDEVRRVLDSDNGHAFLAFCQLSERELRSASFHRTNPLYADFIEDCLSTKRKLDDKTDVCFKRIQVEEI